MNKHPIYKNWYYIFGGVFAILAFSNLIFPITYDDDFYYSKIGNPFLLQLEEYFIYQGRYLTHTIARIILQLGFPYTDLIQSLFMTFLVGIMYFHVNPQFLSSHNKKDYLLFSLLAVMTFSLVGGSWTTFTQTLFLMSNYFSVGLWLLFLAFYRIWLDDTTYKPKITLLIITGLIAGSLQEQGIALLPLLLILAFIQKHVRKISLPSWYWIGFVSFLIGYLPLILSPGATSIEKIKDYSNAESWNFMGQQINWLALGWKRYFYSLFNWLFLHAYAWIPQTSIYQIIFIILLKKHIKNSSTLTIAGFLYIGSWGIFAVMMFSPLYYQATFNNALLFLFVSVIFLTHQCKLTPKTFKILTILTCLIGGIVWGVQVPSWIHYNKEYRKAVQLIQTAKANGQDEVIVSHFSQFTINTPVGKIIPVYLYTSQTFYKRMAEYYNIKKITPQKTSP